ncbi:hypothetical protein BGZ83_008297, partial [Gryganskiella cystojenkinii]
MPLPLVPDLLTICMFGYDLWGKPSAPPHLGVSNRKTLEEMPSSLWQPLVDYPMDDEYAIIGYASDIIASLATLEVVFVAVDLIACRRIGRLQRALLKQEQRQYEELAQKKKKRLENHSSIELTTHDRSIKDKERDSDDDMVPVVETINLDEVDPEVVVSVNASRPTPTRVPTYQLYLERQRLSGSDGEGDHAGIEIPERDTVVSNTTP